MKFNVKKLTSLLTASLLLAGGLVGLAAVPASAASRVTAFDFEANPIGAPNWYDLYSFSQGNNGWANIVDSTSGMPANSPGGGTKALKGVEGSGLWSGTNIGSVDSADSLLGAGSLKASVVFYSPIAGETLRLKVENRADSTQSIAADQVTVAGWQTLIFDFASPSSGSFNPSVNYNIATVTFGPSIQTLQTQPYFIDSVLFAASSTQSQQQQQQTVDYDVRLTSSLKNTATDAYAWTSCGVQSWCVNNNYYMKMIAAGASTTLTYVVTIHGTSTAVANASVNLRMNTAYSGSNATWSSGGTSFGAVSSSSNADAGTISGTTNSSGEVSFTFANTNNSGEATRTLNNANPYPSGCNSPAGQTKGAIEPTVTAVSGATIGVQYVDVLWPHISSATINSSIAAGSDGSNCTTATPARPGTKVWSPAFDADNKGHYPHIRLEKSFLNEKLDGTWWDGVWQYRDADTRAYLKYIPAGSTFVLNYTVTDAWGNPYEGAKVSLIVNANYSCSKTYFAYEGSLIGPDDCAGGGQTELPAKVANSKGQVTFVLTNTNTNGEAMPIDLNGAPNPASKELGTNIKPHVVGATQEGIDMLFAHFVSETGAAKATGPGVKSATIGTYQSSEFSLTDENGKPISNTDVKYFVNGFDSKVGFAHTDAAGKVSIRSTNSSGQEGMQTVGVSLTRDGKLPLTATATLNWTAPALSISATGDSRAVIVSVAGASGKAVQINVAGKTYRRVAQAAIAEFSIPSTAGKKAVKVVVSGKTLSKSVTVTK